MDIGPAVELAVAELHYAIDEYPKHNSPHESFAILKEEVDELWDEVRLNGKTENSEKMRAEAVQVAAMAIRFLTDCC